MKTLKSIMILIAPAVFYLLACVIKIYRVEGFMLPAIILFFASVIFAVGYIIYQGYKFHKKIENLNHKVE